MKKTILWGIGGLLIISGGILMYSAMALRKKPDFKANRGKYLYLVLGGVILGLIGAVILGVQFAKD